MIVNNRKGFVFGVVAAGIVVSYAVSRFAGLTKLPIFIDEATFIEFAMRVWQGNPLGQLADGKLLHVWLIALVVPWASDPLWAARAMTVLEGGLALYACFHIGARLYNRKAGLLCAALYVICPFTLFHDRMALADGLLSAFAALTLLWSIALVQDQKRRYAVLLGLAMAGAILSKIPGLLYLLTPLCTVILLAKPPRLRLVRQLALSYGIALALTVFPVVKFLLTTEHTSRHSVIGKNSEELIKQIAWNAQQAFEWLWFYWTPPVLIVGVVGLVFAIVKRKREHLLLGAISLLPILAFAVISKIWFARYLLPATVPVLELVAGIMTGNNGAEDWSRRLRLPKFAQRLHALPSILFLVVVGLFAYRIDWRLLTDPALTPFPPAEITQYVQIWPSGYGVAEAAGYLRELAHLSEDGIIVVHHRYGDNIDFGLKGYLLHEKRIEFRWVKLRNANDITTFVDSSRTKPTFVVLDRPPIPEVPEELPDVPELLRVAELVKSYPKPGGAASVEVYRLNPSKAAAERRIKNILLNPDFEDLKAGRPISWELAGRPVVDSSSQHSFSGSVAIRCDWAGDVLYQKLSTNVGGTYFFSSKVRGGMEHRSAKLQANWYDKEGRLLKEATKVCEAGVDWTRCDLSFEAPMNATSVFAYASPLDPGPVWFDDFSFGTDERHPAP
jgi:hypothetical protein